ncbi:MAG: TRAP transporter small permease subunit, partial [Sulfuriferula sp.]
MQILLAMARVIDALNEWVGRSVKWLVLLVTLISTVNALVRYVFGTSSNAGLEIQWYLFGALFLLAAGYALKHNAHVRIDFIYGRLSKRGQAAIDVFGVLLFLLPFTVLIIWFSWPMFMLAWQSG